MKENFSKPNFFFLLNTAFSTLCDVAQFILPVNMQKSMQKNNMAELL